MPEKPITAYPILSWRKIERLVRVLEKPGEIRLDHIRANKGSLALHMGLTHHLRTEPLNNEGIDGQLEIIGFEFNPDAQLDEIYGKKEKYYTFGWKRGLWIANANHQYANDYTLIYLTWNEKFDKKKSDAVLTFTGTDD